MRRVVLKSTTAVYGSCSRDPALFTEAMRPQGCPVGRLRQGRLDIEGYVRGVRPPPPRRRGHRAAVHQLHRPAHRHRASPATSRCRSCPRCSATTPACSCCTRRTRWPCCEPRDDRRLRRHGERRRRRHAAALAGDPPAGPGRGPGARARGRLGRPASSAALGFVDYSPEQMRFLNFGRVVDTTLLRTEFGYTPRCTTGGRSTTTARPRAPPGDLARPGRVGGARRARRREGAPVTTARTRRPRASRRSSVSAARIIPLHADESGGRTRWRLRPASSRCRPRRPSPTPAPTAAGWEEQLAELLEFLRRRLTGDYADRRVRLRPPTSPTTSCSPLLRPLFEKWFRVEANGLENVPDVGGALVVANHSGTLPLDALMTTVALHDEHPAQRQLRLLGADLVFEMPVIGPLARKTGATLACNADAERLLTDGRARRRVPRGVQGHRQAVPGPVQAAALRPRRLRHGGAAHRGADHPVLDRRRRGDLPDDRRRQAAGPAARRCRTSRSRRRSRCSARSGWCRCRRSGRSSSASRSSTGALRRRPPPRTR